MNCLQFLAGNSWSSSDQVEVLYKKKILGFRFLSLYWNLVSTNSALLIITVLNFIWNWEGDVPTREDGVGNFLTKSLRIVFLPYSSLRFKTVFAISVSVWWLFLLQDSSGKKTFNQTPLLFIIDHIHTNCLTKRLTRFYSLEIEFKDKRIQFVRILVWIASVILIKIQQLYLCVQLSSSGSE